MGFYEKPLVKFERLLETYIAFAPRGYVVPDGHVALARATSSGWRRHHSSTSRVTKARSCSGSTTSHMPHPPSIPSPFEEAAILTIDGVGEWATSSIGVGRGNQIDDAARTTVSAFARAALFRVHLLHRIPGELRRVQVHGPCAVRRAEVRLRHQGPPARDQRRWQSLDEQSTSPIRTA